jgi:hypothetical protein
MFNDLIFWSGKLITLYLIYYVMLLLCVGFVWLYMPISMPCVRKCGFNMIRVRNVGRVS